MVASSVAALISITNDSSNVHLSGRSASATLSSSQTGRLLDATRLGRALS